MVLLVFLTFQKVKIILAIIFGYEKMVTTNVRMGIMQLKNCEQAYGERAHRLNGIQKTLGERAHMLWRCFIVWHDPVEHG